MTFAEQPPSKHWAALKYRGEKFAEVWFKPEGEPLALAFRIPQESFQIPGMDQQLTMENLLRAVAVAPEEVESWQQDEASQSGMGGSNPGFQAPLAPPQQAAYVEIFVRLSPPPTLSTQATEEADGGTNELEVPVNWHDLEARWRTILVLETALESLRMGMESLQTEMETALRQTLTLEEKTHALRADVALWDRAKKRVQFAVPKVKDFIHRATWAMGSPERKRLEAVYKEHIHPHIPFPQLNEVLKQLEDLQKDRQVLTGLGKSVYHECKAMSAEIQGALKTLHNNAVTAAQKKRGEDVSKKRFRK